ncbi:hypothetical protein [Prochlorococcus sp. MIT 1341]|uniref:hypothetical protein n=1 Tax=Prochlorococcus sp. MIT 1341 TaxID=3096221 RepID=UPI002A75A319|nr:hypothetical protein [Prochlorococcus sp. MIT 1341]
MKGNYISKQISKCIKRSSPLYEYWNSEQNSNDEKNRLAKINSEEIYKPGLLLYREEPYKWEILYQCIIRELILDKTHSTRALKKMLFTLNSACRSQLINSLEENDILIKDIIEDLKQLSTEKMQVIVNKNNENSYSIWTFLRILICIFTNPFDLHIKKEKVRIYEKTGSLIYSIKQVTNNI